jgi:hypothetical protein
MAYVAYIVVGLALIGALASWVVGAVYWIRTLRSIAQTAQPSGLLLRAIVAWPFAVGRLRGAAASQAAIVNKALVAFIVCLIVSIAALSVATNLARISR